MSFQFLIPIYKLISPTLPQKSLSNNFVSFPEASERQCAERQMGGWGVGESCAEFIRSANGLTGESATWHPWF